MKLFTAALAIAATAALSAFPSGQPMPHSNLPGWRLVFDDDFGRNVPVGQFPSAVAAKWGHSYPDGWPDTGHRGTYEPTRTVAFARGMMILALHTEKSGRIDVAAPVPTIPGVATGKAGGQLYGRYAVRFRADPVSGFKTAWMLWPDSNNKKDGEIDFPEGSLDSVIWAFTHHQGAVSPHDQDRFDSNVKYGGTWHTSVVEWRPGSISYYLDGKRIGKSINHVEDTPMHWVLQTEVKSRGSLPPQDKTAHIYIDWVAVWVYAP